jgi:predicted AAA+ superfamily ATPase
MLRVLVDRHAAPLAIESAARDAGLPRSTFEDHLALLQRLFLVRFLPAFATSATRRAMKQRKLMVVDSGLVAWLAGWSASPSAPSTGQAIEGLALQELVRQASWLDPRIRLSHYRSKDGVEVDLVIEGPDRSVVGVEIKSSETPRARDFRHLHHLRAALGPRFRRGVVLHVGRTVASYGDDMWALPLSAIWTAQPDSDG